MARLAGLLVWLAAVVEVALGKAIDNGLVLTPRKVFVPGAVGGVECSAGEVDLMFIVDGSSSITDEDFKEVRAFLISTVKGFQTSKTQWIDGEDPLRVAAIQFSGNPSTEFSFSTFANRSEGAIDYLERQLKHKKGVTNTGQALIYAAEKELVESKGMRRPTPKIVIVFTDGLATDKDNQFFVLTPRFHTLKPPGTKVFAVGVGKADVKQLAFIAGTQDSLSQDCNDNPRECVDLPESVFKGENFAALKGIVTTLVGDAKVCVQVQDSPGTFVEDPENLGIDLTCGPEGITVGSATEKPFEGRLYVKEAYETEGCFVNGDGLTPYAGNLTFDFTSCGTKRRRQLEPPGINIEATVVFQFHQSVQTKIDLPFHIKCFYMETEKSLDADVSVSPLTTLEQRFDLPMPVCSYRVVESYEDNDGNPVIGDEVRFAQVGDKITHLWVCETDYPEFFKMRVHDCTTSTAAAQTAQLVDPNGCGVDDILVTTPNYDARVLTAWVDTHVFKFADKEVISFQCQVSICVTNPQGVSGLEDGDVLCENYPPTDLCNGVETIPGSSDNFAEIEEDTGDQLAYEYEEDGLANRGRQAFNARPRNTFQNNRNRFNSRQNGGRSPFRGKRQARKFFHIPAHQVKFKSDEAGRTRTMDVGVDDLFVADRSDIDLEAVAERRRVKELEARRLAGAAVETGRTVCLTQMEAVLFAALSFGGFVVTAAISVAVHMRNPKETLPLF